MSATIQSFPPCSEKTLNSEINLGKKITKAITEVNDETQVK